MSPAQRSVTFFLQMFVILVVYRVVGWIMKRFFDQPQVIGKMIDGVFPGPSLLGLSGPQLFESVYGKRTRISEELGQLNEVDDGDPPSIAVPAPA